MANERRHGRLLRLLKLGRTIPTESHKGCTRITRGQPYVCLKPHPTVVTPQHGSLHINYLPSSVHWKNRPIWRVPTADSEVYFVLLFCYALVMDNRPRTASISIHILDDDSLLHIFNLYRPYLLGEDEDDNARLWGGRRQWVRGRWWYKIANVCQRWRNVIHASAYYLELSLVCTYRTPVAEMLAHSPPLPLTIDYRYRDITTEDEEESLFALKQRDRVLRVRLEMPVMNLQKGIVAIEEEYPILEYLVIELPAEDNSTILIFPETLQAPRLRHLALRGFALPMGPQLLTTAVGLVTLYLVMVHPSTYFHPNNLLQWISHMPQLKTLSIYFEFSMPNRGVERQLMHIPIVAPVTLPNLHHFQFRGVSTYLEALVQQITTPRLEKLEIDFFNQLSFFVPRLLHLMDTSENLRFGSASFGFFDEKVDALVYPQGEAKMYALGISVFCWHLDWQVSSAAQISNSLSQIFSAVEHLTLTHEVHSRSSDEHNEVDRTEWYKLLRPFSNVKTLRIDNGLVKDLSHFLQLEDNIPLELLAELQELTYSGSGDTGDAFTSFIEARKNAGQPVNLVRRIPIPDPTSPISITPANSKPGSNRDT